MKFWGWIPILTSKILYEYLIDELEHTNFGPITKENKELIELILGTDEYDYSVQEDSEDENSNIFKAIACLKDKKVEHLFFFDENDILKAHARCLICDNGIVRIELDDKSAALSQGIKPTVAKRAYIIIRDIYHSHTHHEKYDDYLLQLVVADNQKEAIEKILGQYEEKIVMYHKTIRTDLKYVDFDAAISLITLAKGEMKYASAFVGLQSTQNPYFECYNNIFSNSLSSISLLADDVEMKINNNTVCYLNTLTVLIIVLTLPVTYITVYNAELNGYISATVYIIIAIILCVTFKHQIKRYFHKIKDFSIAWVKSKGKF
jgi:hypothetical protein